MMQNMIQIVEKFNDRLERLEAKVTGVILQKKKIIKKQDLTIANWNANGIPYKRQKLEIFLNANFMFVYYQRFI